MKWFNGTVADYQNFKQTFYQHIYIQRAMAIEKATALDTLVPEEVWKEYFKGLELTLLDYWTHLERLEKLFGGDERQTEHLMSWTIAYCNKSIKKRSDKDLKDIVYSLESFFKKNKIASTTKNLLSKLLQPAIPKNLQLDYRKDLRATHSMDTLEHFLEYLLINLDAG